VASTVLVVLLPLAACRASDPNALWRIVHDQCVPDQRVRGSPAPCVEVDLSSGEARGYAVLKDLNGPYQFLLIPTVRVAGIESPAMQRADAPNYFAAAWAARRWVERYAGHPLPREALSLAINSRYGRSQNQLHIHIDCLKPAVRTSLQAHLGAIGEQWSDFPVLLAGQAYRARRLRNADLVGADPFRILAASTREGAAELARHTLVVVGAVFEDHAPGFILLDGRADLWSLDRGHGEDLQDHACR
jgi:CDP-diacylglycerol pyrophosphatase